MYTAVSQAYLYIGRNLNHRDNVVTRFLLNDSHVAFAEVYEWVFKLQLGIEPKGSIA